MPAFLEEAEFWVLVAFLISMSYLVYKAKNVVLNALDQRTAKIKAELEEAQRLREEAQATLAEYQRKRRDALKEAEEIVAQARAEAERTAAQGARDLEALVERRKHMAVEKIALAESKALAEVRNAAVDLAVAAAGRVLAQDLDAQQRSALIDDAIANLPATIH